MKVYIDGQYYEKHDAKISVYDHGLLYGDGIFEGIRTYNGKIFKLAEHIDRLYHSAKAINLDIPITKQNLISAVKETVSINNEENIYIRLVVTRGKGTLGINPEKCSVPSVIIIVDEIQLYPDEYYQKGIKCITASTRRISNDSLDPRIKSLNYLNQVMAKMEANYAGCQEAVMLNRDGYVTECTGDNIFIIKDESLITPRSSTGALDGITRDSILKLSEMKNIQSFEILISQYDLYTADECFLTGTGAEVIPVIEIDGRAVGNGKPGEITSLLINAFRNYVTED